MAHVWQPFYSVQWSRYIYIHIDGCVSNSNCWSFSTKHRYNASSAIYGRNFGCRRYRFLIRPRILVEGGKNVFHLAILQQMQQLPESEVTDGLQLPCLLTPFLECTLWRIWDTKHDVRTPGTLTWDTWDIRHGTLGTPQITYETLGTLVTHMGHLRHSSWYTRDTTIYVGTLHLGHFEQSIRKLHGNTTVHVAYSWRWYTNRAIV
jgi:hypothetical protein